ncbi:MAG: imidazole glycerol phosphate synthase subunit HisF, partial [Armatimonadetes bacterium]|nr:imidazole glycerol phosphate synthase subunit HisF [Armatimonadota bacterium]
GYDLTLTRAVADLVPIPVIASGGAGTPAHLRDALTTGGASAVLLSSILHYGEYSVAQIKTYLAGAGLSIRHVTG